VVAAEDYTVVGWVGYALGGALQDPLFGGALTTAMKLGFDVCDAGEGIEIRGMGFEFRVPYKSISDSPVATRDHLLDLMHREVMAITATRPHGRLVGVSEPEPRARFVLDDVRPAGNLHYDPHDIAYRSG
jgi:hypothetical protein